MENKDWEQVARKLERDIAVYENERSQLYNEHNTRKRALEQVRGAMEEALSLTSRWKEMGNLRPDQFHAYFKKKSNDMERLHRYFQDSIRRFGEVINGYPIEDVPERPTLDADSGFDADEEE